MSEMLLQKTGRSLLSPASLGWDDDFLFDGQSIQLPLHARSIHELNRQHELDFGQFFRGGTGRASLRFRRRERLVKLERERGPRTQRDRHAAGRLGGARRGGVAQAVETQPKSTQ
jgi:hypothetical protein